MVFFKASGYSRIMSQEYNVLAPGPVNLHPKVRESLALPMIHHRTPEFDRILKRVLARLKDLFQTTEPVLLPPAPVLAAWRPCWSTP